MLHRPDDCNIKTGSPSTVRLYGFFGMVGSKMVKARNIRPAHGIVMETRTDGAKWLNWQYQNGV
jgi:hypothetical protein